MEIFLEELVQAPRRVGSIALFTSHPNTVICTSLGRKHIHVKDFKDKRTALFSSLPSLRAAEFVPLVFSQDFQDHVTPGQETIAESSHFPNRFE